MKDNLFARSGQAPDEVDPATGAAHVAVPEEVRWLARTLDAAGYDVWAVGGAVRDALNGDQPTDWDLATSARPEQVRRLFRRTVPIGIEHGTVGVLGRSGRMYEVTTFRRDVETFGRKAKVRFSERLEEDLERRDFTINAVALHPLTGEVRDPHGGRLDLDRGVLRTVGDPATRFAEDWLRVLRALRFAGRFGLDIEPATERAIRDSAGKLGDLSAERIREELWKVLTGQRRASRSLRLYGESGVLAALYPELERLRADAEGDLWEATLASVDAASPHRPRVRLAALFHAAAHPEGAVASAAVAREVMRRLRASNADTDAVTHLVAQHAPLPDLSGVAVREWLQRVGREHASDMFRLLIALCRGYTGEGDGLRRLLRFARAELRSGAPLTIAELRIGGAELRSLGIPPGPRYGRILTMLLRQAIDDPAVNEPARLLELAATVAGDAPPEDR